MADFLDGLGRFASDSSSGLVGLGLGIMSGDMGQAATGYMQGQGQDNQRRLIERKQQEEEQKRVAAQGLAQKYGFDPALATADPDAAIGIAKALEVQKRTPKEVSVEQQQWQMLTPEQRQQAAQQKYTGGDGKSLTEQYRQRMQIATQQGLAPDDPAYKSFVLTGKMPREDQAPLTATDKKAIMEADDGVLTGQNALASIDRAIALSKKAYDGPTAGARGAVTGLFGNEAGQATVELDNEVKTNALQSLKAIFGAAPTEGERAMLLEIQGASNQPQAVRERIYAKARVMAERRLKLNEQRANELRGGTFYKPKGGQGAPNATPPTGKTSSGVNWAVD